MKGTPIIAVTVASAITGIHWFLRRREQKLSPAPVSQDGSGAEK